MKSTIDVSNISLIQLNNFCIEYGYEIDITQDKVELVLMEVTK